MNKMSNKQGLRQILIKNGELPEELNSLEIEIVVHTKKALGMRFLGLGPKFKPINSLTKLQIFLDKYAFWAKNRNKKALSKMLKHSTVVVSLWRKDQIVAFGRATSDYVFRAVLWDIVVANEYQGRGIGKVIVDQLLSTKSINNVETIYLMTTNSEDFYTQIGFNKCEKQQLMQI